MSGPHPTKIGFIGAGFIGQLAHLQNYLLLEDCRIVALATGRPELRQKAAERYHIARNYATHLELLKDPEVEAVVAITSRIGVGPVARDCLKAGKHLMTEKPMASTVEQAEKILRTQPKGIVYSIGYMRRYDAGVCQAKRILDELMESKRLGDVIYVRVHCFAGDDYCNAGGHTVTTEKKTATWETWPMAPDWVPEPEKYKYHQYLNFYCHDINLLRFLFGKTPAVSSVKFDDPVYQLVTFDFGGFSALLETGSFPNRPWDEYVEIFFANGRMRIDLPPALLKDVPAKVELYSGNVNGYTQEPIPPLGPSWAFKRQAEAFVQDVSEGRVSVSSGADSIEDIRLTENIWKMKLKGMGKLN
jgi:predicted dehydrogenase